MLLLRAVGLLLVIAPARALFGGPSARARDRLLSAIPTRRFLPPITPESSDRRTATRIAELAAELEATAEPPPPDDERAAVGGWLLRYTDAADVSRLERSQPKGFSLGSVSHPVARLASGALVRARRTVVCEWTGPERVERTTSVAPLPAPARTTYADAAVRIERGPRGELFVLQKRGEGLSSSELAELGA